MSEMIERMARAMAAAFWRDEPEMVAGWEEWLSPARAALRALSDPTDAMIDAGVVASERQSVTAIYRAMIGAAG